MNYLTKKECPLDSNHSVPIYYGIVKVNKLIKAFGKDKIESVMTFNKQVLKGFNEEEIWKRFKTKIESKINSKYKEYPISELIKFKDKALTKKKSARTYSLESVILEKHLGFGIND